MTKKDDVHSELKRAADLLRKSRKKKRAYEKKRIKDGYEGIDNLFKSIGKSAEKELILWRKVGEKMAKETGDYEYHKAIKILLELADEY